MSEELLVKHLVIRIGGRPNLEDNRYDGPGADALITEWVKKGFTVKHVAVIQVQPEGPTVFYCLVKEGSTLITPSVRA